LGLVDHPSMEKNTTNIELSPVRKESKKKGDPDWYDLPKETAGGPKMDLPEDRDVEQAEMKETDKEEEKEEKEEKVEKEKRKPKHGKVFNFLCGEPPSDDWVPVNSFGPRGIHDFFKGMFRILVGNKINVLLIFIPFAFAAGGRWGTAWTFALCMLSIIPLSKLLGSATEELALRTNQTIGGLLNATFGNAVEMIVGIIALQGKLYKVVHASLLGSILSNLLLVLGMSFFFGGLLHKEQSFNVTASQTGASMLLIATTAMVLPAAFLIASAPTGNSFFLIVNSTIQNTTDFNEATLNATANDSTLTSDTTAEIYVSRGTAVILLVIYICYLIFQLKTHRHLYEDSGGEDEEEKPQLPVWGAIVLLAAATILVSFLADELVNSIEDLKRYGLTETFIAIILIPIVGNAAEHVTAVSVAMKDKMDLSIGVAVGSSIQISVLVIPFLVILGWIIDRPLTLNFYTFETVTMFISVILVNSVVSDGHSNWLEGALLMATYLIIAIGFFFHK